MIMFSAIGGMYETKQTRIYPTLSNYVDCLKEELLTCYELVRKSMDGEQQRRKTYYDRRTFGPKKGMGVLVMVFDPSKKTGQSTKF